jgi:hypothetical protein
MIQNTLGEIIYKSTINAIFTTIAVEDLAKGYYTLSLIEKGSVKSTNKIVVY